MLIRSPKELALQIATQRKKLKLSQTTVGKSVGLKQQTVSDFEIKPEVTQLDTLFRILSALNLDLKLVPKDQEETGKNEWHEEW